MALIDKTVQPYERRFIVAKMGSAGTFTEGRRTFRIWQFITFHVPNGLPFAAEFVGKAPVDKRGFLKLESLRAGQIVVKPGFIYNKVAMTGVIMAEHLKAMKTWKPPVPEVVYEKDLSAPAVDMGIIDLTGATKQ